MRPYDWGPVIEDIAVTFVPGNLAALNIIAVLLLLEWRFE